MAARTRSSSPDRPARPLPPPGVLAGPVLALALAIVCGCSGPLPGGNLPPADMSLAPSCPQAFTTRLTLFTRETIAWLNGVALRHDGRFAFVGGSSFAEPEAGFSYNYWAAVVDNLGGLRWSARDNWSPGRVARLHQGARSFVLLPDDSIVIAGSQMDGLRLTRRDPSGQVVWTHDFSGSGIVDEEFGLARVAEGRYAVVGSHGDPNTGVTTAFVRLIDEAGQQAWTLDLALGFASRGRAIVALPDGSVVVGGLVTAAAAAVRGKPFLARIDGAGHLVWQQVYPLDSVTGGTAIAPLADGGVIFVGSVFGERRSEGLLARTDDKGMILWQRTYGGVEDDYLWALAPIDGAFPGGPGFVLAGQTASTGAGDQDIWLLRTDEMGTLAWQKTYGEKFWDVAYAVAPIPASASGGAGFLIGGSFSVPDQSERADAWLGRTDENGNARCGDSCVYARDLYCEDGLRCDPAVCTMSSTCVYSHVTRACLPDGGT